MLLDPLTLAIATPYGQVSWRGSSAYVLVGGALGDCNKKQLSLGDWGLCRYNLTSVENNVFMFQILRVRIIAKFVQRSFFLCL